MLFLLATGFSASGATLPALPKEYLDTTLPVQTGSVLEVAANCSDLQAKIDAARLGDTIVIPQQATCTGNYVLRAKPAGSGWIVIRTSAIAQLPEANRRITPDSAPLLPKIVAAHGLPAFSTEVGTHHYRLIGLEITAPEDVGTNDLVTLGDGSPAQTTLAGVASDIVIDRCYIHGAPHQKIKRGVALNSARSAIIDSYMSELHTSAQDSQAIGGWNGPGPYKIVNNFLSASTENIMFGGADVYIPNLVPSDIEIRGNYFFKPLSWKTGDPSFAGETWTIKNLFELKNARRVLLEGNLLDQSMGTYAILLTVRAENTHVPWAAVEDITVTGNLVRHAGGGMDILGNDDLSNSLGITQRVLIADNVFEDISRNWGQWGIGFLVLRGPVDLTIDHNTVFQSFASVVSADSPTPPAQGFVYTNNIAAGNISGTGLGPGFPSLDAFFPGATIAGNLFAGAKSSLYPTGNYFPADLNAVGFVDLAGGNYRLAPSSPYRGKCADGKNPGADIDLVSQNAGMALTGTARPSGMRTPRREPRAPIR
jgi:hypothetical protein